MTSRSRRSGPTIRRPGQPFPGGIIPADAIRRRGQDHSGSVRPAVEPAQPLLRGQRARSDQDRRGDASSSIITCRRTASLAVSYFYLNGHRHAAAVRLGQHPVGRSRLQLDAAQPQRRRHVDAQPDDDQPVEVHVYAAVRRPRQQSDDVARRPELELQDPGRSDAAAPDRHRVTSPAQTAIAGPDAGSDYWSIRDNVIISKGNHSFKLGGEVSYEKIVHDTLLDNYGVFSVQRQQDRQRLRGLPARPAGDDVAGRAGAEAGQRRVLQRSSRRTITASTRA